MNKHAPKIFFLFIGLWIAFTPSVAQTTATGSVEGGVIEMGPSQRGIRGVTVSVTNRDTRWTRTITTGAEGQYKMYLLPPGYYTITSAHKDYEPMEKNSSQYNFLVSMQNNRVILPLITLKPLRSRSGIAIPSKNQISDLSFRIQLPSELDTLQASLYAIAIDIAPGPRERAMGSPSRKDLLWQKLLNHSFEIRTPKDLNLLIMGLASRSRPSAVATRVRQVTGAGQSGTTAPPQTAQAPIPQNDTDLPAVESDARQLVNSTTASRGWSFDRRALLYLPLPGVRTFDDLAFLLPGIVPPTQSIGGAAGPGVAPGVGTSGQFSVNGMRSRSNNFTIDGADNNDDEYGVRRQGFHSPIPQSIESLQEYQISAVLPEPQFGRNMGSQVHAVSRPGGANFHGTLYGFYTDKRLKARDPFDLTGGPATFPITRGGIPVRVNGQPLAPSNPVGGENSYTRGQYGFVFGGPIIREKTHFFVSYERQDLNAVKESHFAVPTVAERGLFGTSDVGPLSTSLGGDAVFSYFPFPNNPRGPYGPNTFTEVLPAGAHGQIFSARIDHKLRFLKSDHFLTGRYNFTDDNSILPVTGEALFSSLQPRTRTRNLSFLFNSVLSHRMTNEFRSSYGEYRLKFEEVRDPYLRPSRLVLQKQFLLNAPLLANVTGSGRNPEYVRLCGSPGQYSLCPPGTTGNEVDTESILGVTGQVIVSGFSPIGVDVYNFPQGRNNRTFHFADTLFYHLFRQTFTAGFDTRLIHANSFLDRNFRPLKVFNATDTRLSSLTANGLPKLTRGADFAAVGIPTASVQTQALVPDSSLRLRSWQNDFFLADQIRLLRSLTLNLGVRYSLNTTPRDVNRRIDSSFPSLDVRNFINQERSLTGASGLEKFLGGRTQIYRRDNNNVVPYLTLAWDPYGDGKTAIRAGYGSYYDQIPGAVVGQSRNLLPNFINLDFAAFANSNFCGNQNSALFVAGANSVVPGTLNTLDRTCVKDSVTYLAQIATTGRNAQFSSGTSFVLPDANLVTPYSQHWSLTIETEAFRDFLISVGYVGTRGVHLLKFTTPNLGSNAVVTLTNIGRTSSILTGPNSNQPITKQQPTLIGSSAPPKTQQGEQRPFPFLGTLTSIESGANSSYHSFQLQVNKRFSRGLQFTTAYTWSHVIDEASDLFALAGSPTLPQDNSQWGAERASANFDVRHRFVYSFVWDLPIFSQSKLLGGWRLASIGALQTGQPYTIMGGLDVNRDGNVTDRLNTVQGITEVNNGRVRFLTPADLSGLLASSGQDGAVGRNSFRRAGIATIDLGIHKDFRFGDRHKLEARTEIFNVFNRTNFGLPIHQLFFPSLGQSVDTRVPARTIQIATKYSF